MATSYEEDFTEQTKQNLAALASSMLIDISKQRYRFVDVEFDGGGGGGGGGGGELIGISPIDYSSLNSNSPAIGTSAAAYHRYTPQYFVPTTRVYQNMPVIDEVD